MAKQINRSKLSPVIALWVYADQKTLVVECENGFAYELEGAYNNIAYAITDHMFNEVEIVTDRRPIKTKYPDESLPF